LVASADFNTIIEALVRSIRKPHSQSLFRKLMMTEVMRQPQNPRHVATAHLRGRFANLAIELGVLFNDEHARLRPLALQHQRRGRAGKRATNDYYVIIKLHGRQREWTLAGANAIVFRDLH